jgi:hypothetical protein
LAPLAPLAPLSASFAVEMVCIYVVKGDCIESASFVFGSTVMLDV